MKPLDFLMFALLVSWLTLYISEEYIQGLYALVLFCMIVIIKVVEGKK